MTGGSEGNALTFFVALVVIVLAWVGGRLTAQVATRKRVKREEKLERISEEQKAAAESRQERREADGEARRRHDAETAPGEGLPPSLEEKLRRLARKRGRDLSVLLLALLPLAAVAQEEPVLVDGDGIPVTFSQREAAQLAGEVLALRSRLAAANREIDRLRGVVDSCESDIDRMALLDQRAERLYRAEARQKRWASRGQRIRWAVVAGTAGYVLGDLSDD